MMLRRFRHDYVELSEVEAAALNSPLYNGYVLEIHPPQFESVPATLTQVIREIREIQSGLLQFGNYSPVCAFEIMRTSPDTLHLQLAVPTKRLERKVRAHLHEAVPAVHFSSGTTGVPVADEGTIGGGILTAGRQDWFPFEINHSTPPVNHVIAALHPHAMSGSRFVIQNLFQPVAGISMRRWYNTRRAYQQIGHLRKHKEKLWGSRPPTPREQRQADAIEAKVSQPQFWCAIRILVIDAGEHTRSRLKEVSGAFNIYENPATNQYFQLETMRPFRRKNVYRFASAVAARTYGPWSLRFRVTEEELGSFVTLPDLQQSNLHYAQA